MSQIASQHSATEGGFTMTEVGIASAIIGPLMLAFMGASNVVGTTLAENERTADVTTTARGIGTKVAKLLMRAAPDTLRTRTAPLVRVLDSDVVSVAPNSKFYRDMNSDPERNAMLQLGIKIAPQAVDTHATPNFLSGITDTDPAAGLKTQKLAAMGAAVSQVTTLSQLPDHTRYVTPFTNYGEYRDELYAWQSAIATGQKRGWIPVQHFMPSESVQFQAVGGAMSMNATGRSSVRELEFVRDPKEKMNGIDDDGDGMIDEGRLVLKTGQTRSVLASKVEVCTFTLEGRVMRFTIRCCRRDRHGRVHRTTIQKRIMVRNDK